MNLKFKPVKTLFLLINLYLNYVFCNKAVICPLNFVCECTEDHGRSVLTLELDCTRKNLTEVPNWSRIATMPVSLINLSHNKLKVIKEDAFEGLTFSDQIPGEWIPKLDLSDNPLKEISPLGFRGIVHESLYLKLHNTELELFPMESLQQIKNLTDFFFTNSKVTDIPNGSFQGLKKLRRIDLSGTKMTHLREHVFLGLENCLKSVYLNNMGLKEFPSMTLKKLRVMWELKINHNLIKTLPARIFEGFEATTIKMVIFMQHNQLSEIHDNAFAKFKLRIYQIFLQYNNINNTKWLEHPCSLSFLTYGYINLWDNPMICTCDINSILKAGFYDIHGSCTSPPIFARIPWISKDFDVIGYRQCNVTTRWKLNCMESGHTSFSFSFFSSKGMMRVLLFSLIMAFKIY